MEPLRTVEFALRFAASLSAWWLLLAMPVVVAFGMMIYRRQSRGIARKHAWGLAALRAITLSVILFLAFRPSLIRRDISTYPGRLLFVLDDSASMGVHDPALPDGEALTIAREALDSFAGREAPLADLRVKALDMERELILFELFGRSADRTRDAFWQESDRVQGIVNKQLENIVSRAADLANHAGAGSKVQDISAVCRELNASLPPLFTGEQPPTREFVLNMRKSLSDLVDLLREAQISADMAAIAAGDRTLSQAIETVRRTQRLDLVYSWLRSHRDSITDKVNGLSTWLLPLSRKEPILFSEIGEKAPALSTVETDITGVLLDRLEENTRFPLAGIVLFTDGRNLGGITLDSVTRAAALRSVPVNFAVIGGAEEPPDIAVRELVYPPFAAAGKPIVTRVELKTVLPKPAKVELALIEAGTNAIPVEELQIEEAHAMQRRMAYTPTEEGLLRLTVHVGSAAGEVIPAENNRMDMAFRVVPPDRVRVLFLDWKPRWESRFVLDVFRRLDYLDVNGLIVLALPDCELKRGVGKGFWPEDSGMLALYEVVVLGDVPSQLLTEAEWQELAGYVEAGGNLVLLGTGQRDPLPAGVAKALLPTQPRGAEVFAQADTTSLQLTGAGRHHPITRSLLSFDPVQNAESIGTDRIRSETLALLQSGNGLSLISARFIGKGKTLFIDTDRMWRRLNSAALNAHIAMVAAIPEWAVESRSPDGDQPRPDLYRYTSRESAQVWVDSGGETNIVVELRDGDRLLESPAVPQHQGAKLAAAVFDKLPPGEWTVTRQSGGSAPEKIHVVDRSRELHDLSSDEPWLRKLASNAGGAGAMFVDAERLLNNVHPRSHVERQERIWRLWDSILVLWFLVIMLTVEWIWRKLAGLV